MLAQTNITKLIKSCIRVIPSRFYNDATASRSTKEEKRALTRISVAE